MTGRHGACYNVPMQNTDTTLNRRIAQLDEEFLLLDSRAPIEDVEGPTCSICDGVGHGYPGGAPCPLEMRGEEGVPWWAQ